MRDQHVPPEFGLQKEAFLTEEELLFALARRLEQLLDEDAGALWNLLYRLDIDEKSVNSAIGGSSNAAAALARLILDRQYEKRATKVSQTRPGTSAEDADLLL